MSAKQGGYCGIWLGVMQSARVQHRRDILLFYGMKTVDIIADRVGDIK